MYKLEGFDTDWLTVGESPIVTYSNLRYGDYTFRVKVANSDGVWSDDEVSLGGTYSSSFLSLYMGVLCVCSADYRLLPVYGYVFQETQ